MPDCYCAALYAFEEYVNAADLQGFTQVKVAEETADHFVGLTSPIEAQTAMVQTPALVRTLEEANVSVLPDKVIREVQGPCGVTVIQQLIVQVVRL